MKAPAQDFQLSEFTVIICNMQCMFGNLTEEKEENPEKKKTLLGTPVSNVNI